MLTIDDLKPVYLLPEDVLSGEKLFPLTRVDHLRDRLIGGPTEAHLSQVWQSIRVVPMHSRPILRGFMGYTQGVIDAESYRDWVTTLLRVVRWMPGVVLVERGESSNAWVSDSRWVCSCDCGNCPSASRDWGIAICCECGSVWTPVFPPDAEEIEAGLLAIPDPMERDYKETRLLKGRA